MKKLTELTNRKIVGKLIKIQKVAKDLENVLYHDYHSFPTDMVEWLFYYHFTDEIRETINEINALIAEEGGAQ